METNTKKLQFSIISYFDPFGDMKSTRKQFSRRNFVSEKTLEEVEKIIETYSNGKYYNGVEIAPTVGRSKYFYDFDKSSYLTSKAESSNYESIPGY